MTIPGYSSTGSKRPEALFGTCDGVPGRMTRAFGCRVWDEHGNEYVDTVMALGAVALGYAHPAVVAAVAQAMRDGCVGSLAPTLEVEVAERLTEVLPGVESVRFLKTGAEAAAAAVRIARVATGRDRVVTCGYHGWLDWSQDTSGVPRNVAALRSELAFNDNAALPRVVDSTVAAVIVEPVIDGPPEPAWLEAVRAQTTRAGAVLVFDEIKTAFRVEIGGVAQQSGVVPDLMVVGKALGNGLPIAAVGGNRSLMDAATRTWISSTLATEFASLAAARAVLDVFEAERVAAHVRRVGGELFAGFERLARRYDAVVDGVRGIPQMCYLKFRDADVGGRTARAAAHHGVLFKRSAYNFVSLAHDASTVAWALERLETALEAVTAAC